MSYQPDPKYFDWGSAFQGGIQQSQDNKRQNALMDLQQKQYGLNEQRVGLEQKRYDQSAEEMKRAQEKETIGRRALMKDYSLLPEMGIDFDQNDPEDRAAADEILAQFAQAYGGFEPMRPQAPGQLYKMADGTYAPAEGAIGGQFYNEPNAPTQPPAPSYTEIVDPTNPKQMLRIDGRLYRGGGLGSPGVIGISGKEPSAAKADETRGTGKSSVTDIVTTLRDAYGQLHKGGGIVDPKAGAIENIGNRVQSSSVGQFVGGAIGTSNQSLRNQIKQSRPLLLQAIRQATGMTGKQMDSNVELQLYLSAATDPELDITANMEALDNLDRLYGLGLDGGGAKPIRSAPSGTTMRFDANGEPIQ